MSNENKIQKLRNEIKVIREFIQNMTASEAMPYINIAIDKGMEIIALGGKPE